MELMVVDDDVTACSGIVRRLERMPDSRSFHIRSAVSGEEALCALEESAADILITDIHMHRLSGLDLIEQAKRRCPDMSCIILTAFKDFEYAQRALRMNVDDFLLKPCTERAMMEAVTKVIERRRRLQLSAESLTPVEWACAYLRKHLYDDVDMAFIANRLNLSYSYFSKLFRDSVGQTFTEFALALKMKEASRLLCQGESPSQIADRLHYSGLQNFTRAFSKHFGTTPSQYRSQHALQPTADAHRDGLLP
ncbi:MAG: response regulator [Clostridia bacterium]